jgi:GAF domain-containing protein
MPDVSTLVIAGAVWTLLVILVWALCVAAARGEGRQERADAKADQGQRPTVVADTGAIRVHLAESVEVLRAEQLTVTVDIDGRDAVLASSRAVVEARPGKRAQLDVPVRLDGRRVAMLRASRAPGAARFDAADMLLAQGVAARVASSMQTAHSSGSVPADAPSAMA